jgi:hypothetical protein
MSNIHSYKSVPHQLKTAVATSLITRIISSGWGFNLTVLIIHSVHCLFTKGMYRRNAKNSTAERYTADTFKISKSSSPLL